MPTRPFVPIEHRKTTDLIFLHDPLSFFDILILEAVDDLPSHDFFDRGVLDLPSATARTARSRSASMLTRRSPSQTGRTSTSRERICSAASWIELFGEVASTYIVIIRLSCIFSMG